MHGNVSLGLCNGLIGTIHTVQWSNDEANKMDTLSTICLVIEMLNKSTWGVKKCEAIGSNIVNRHAGMCNQKL